MHRFPFLSYALTRLNILTAYLNHRLTPLLSNDHPWRRKTEAWSNTPLKFATAVAGSCQLGIILGLFCSTIVLRSFGYLYLLMLAGWLLTFNSRWRQHTFSSPLARLLHEFFSQPDSYALAAGLLLGGMLFGYGFGPALLCLPLILYPFAQQRLRSYWHASVQACLDFCADYDPLLASRLSAVQKLEDSTPVQTYSQWVKVTG